MVVLFVGSCSAPASAYASIISFSPTETYINTTRFIQKKFNQYIECFLPDEPEYSDSFNDTLSVDVQDFNTTDNFYVSPVYCFSGKMRFQYTNGNMEIVTSTIRIQSGVSPFNGSTYPNITTYRVNRFYPDIGGQIPSVGSWIFNRKVYNSQGEEISSSDFAFVFNRMPAPDIYSNGDFGFTPTNVNGYYVNSLGAWSADYVNNNSCVFRTNSVNEIPIEDTMDFNDRYSDTTLFRMDYSLTNYYSCLCLSNNGDFIDAVNDRQNSLNYGINYKPVINKVSLPAFTVINSSTVNNYNDYGISYINNNFEYNTNDFSVHYNNYDLPDIETNWLNIFSNQPNVGEPFTSPVRFNFVDIMTVPDTSPYLPESWLSDYPNISTAPNLDISITTIPLYTLPSEYVSCGAELVNVGFDFYSAVPALLGIVFFMGVAGILINKFL